MYIYIYTYIPKAKGPGAHLRSRKVPYLSTLLGSFPDISIYGNQPPFLGSFPFTNKRISLTSAQVRGLPDSLCAALRACERFEPEVRVQFMAYDMELGEKS